MSAHLRGIDHVLIGVGDLEQARHIWARLGFVVTPRGRHEGWGTANHCIMFPNDYLELLGLVEPGAPSGGLEEALCSRGDGLLGLALASADRDATADAWAGAGLEVGTADLARLLEDGSGTRLRFANVTLDDPPAGLRLFACQALDPEPLRRHEWLAHSNGAQGIGSMTLATRRPAAFASVLGNLFGENALTFTDDLLTIHSGHGLLFVASADDLEMLHPALGPVAVTDELRPVALTLLVEDVERSAAGFDEAAVSYDREAGATLAVAADEASGVHLEFTAAEQFHLRPGVRA